MEKFECQFIVVLTVETRAIKCNGDLKIEFSSTNSKSLIVLKMKIPITRTS